MQVAPAKFPRSLITVMVSIANDGAHEADKMVKTCLATICELGRFSMVIEYTSITHDDSVIFSMYYLLNGFPQLYDLYFIFFYIIY